MVTCMKQTIVKLKLVRKPQILRNAVMQIGKLSEVMICSQIEENSLFTRLGKLDGVLKIVDRVFEKV
jgi:protein gp37